MVGEAARETLGFTLQVLSKLERIELKKPSKSLNFVRKATIKAIEKSRFYLDAYRDDSHWDDDGNLIVKLKN